MNKNKKGIIDYGLVGGLALISSTAVAAVTAVDVSQVSTVAKTVSDIASVNPLVACVYIMAFVVISNTLYMWNKDRITAKAQETQYDKNNELAREQLKEQAKLTVELARMNNNQERTNDNLNERPCIYKHEYSKPQNDKPI